MEKISIILPIYNVEKYLATCIESLLSQIHQNLEIILVNDGSKDGSLKVCKEYAEKDSRIIVIDKPNEGVAITRNRGIEAATGDYIAFVDPDDWVEPQMYHSLLNHIKKWDSPVCLCNFYKDTKRRSQQKVFEFEDEVLVADEIVDKLINDMIGVADLLPKYTMIMGSVWRGLYKRSFIEEHHLRFIPKLTIMEDLVFMVQVLLKCDKVAIDQNTWYHYVQHANSALHSYNHQLWEDQLVVYEHLEKSLKEAHLEEDMRNRLDIRYIGMVLTAIKNETYMKKDGDLKDTITHIKEIFMDDTLRCVLERIKPIQVEKNPEKVEKVKKIRKAKKNEEVPTQKARKRKSIQLKEKKDKKQFDIEETPD
ncbi:MAG: glycosyltransferase [Cellulosilyticum sp.]|nr:glycosyltransferase [Cellulosilyticum sp.]